MKNRNKTKKLVDRLVFRGLFALYAILLYMLIDKLIHKQQTLRSLATVFISVIVTVVIVTVGMTVIVKKYGPYRAEGEKPLPFIVYFGIFMIGQYWFNIIQKKANIVVETSTDISVGIIKIVALVTLLFISIIIIGKAMEFITLKYNDRIKGNEQK